MDKKYIYHSKIGTLFLLLLSILLMSACSTTHRKDGPPGFYVDETKIPNATPKVEQLSKYGNMPFYNVFGKRYYVMPSCKHYEERGVASWYGTKFHAQRTSSGERYNMLAMTAAHKTLPLPCYVEVTNLQNHRRIVVKVNDRGPFESNRLIDLSYVAAKKLGMLGHGTAYVNVKLIDPLESSQHNNYFAHNKSTNTYQAIKSHPAHSGSGLFIQVGSFHNRSRAEKLQKRLAVLLPSPVHVNLSDHLYRVQVGPFADREAANRINKRLKTIGITTAHLDEKSKHFA